MVRKKSEWYPGSIHHITCRGNRRSDIFKAEEDYIIFLAIVKEVMEKSKEMTCQSPPKGSGQPP